MPLTAVGTVTLDGQELVIDVDEAGAAGSTCPAFVVGAASDALDLRYPARPALRAGAERGDARRTTACTSPAARVDTVLSGG